MRILSAAAVPCYNQEIPAPMTRREALRGFLLGPGVAVAMVHAPAAAARLTTASPLVRLARTVDRLRFRSLFRNLVRTRERLDRYDAAAVAGRALSPTKRAPLQKFLERARAETWPLWRRWPAAVTEGWIP